ncbi:hypothetical protein K493DRAFT_286769 [Basidiobolus meristosporus CBS 931.73]|uniref:Na+/solute symporter n=1 Tax=Basidiobolus meristosporus CBS 931.73 TaxID=1314790 RepID=A0A1Y1Y0D7_9FUNG|nr:hypothetical protein K493DRAFT_286769 [Basidiobolus meristosporus CBS 931.73]|eukprot:ORX91482.1 hypothetical protein K493DRAFT_286769 [Basidiobolus meristosporus CBS 931.73]
MASLPVAAYTTSVVVCVGFAIFALIWSRKMKEKNDNPDFFLTARNSQPTARIAWSFYAAAVGAWTLFGPPSYALYAGIIGITFYAIACGIPIFVVAFFGGKIQERFPQVQSMADFVRWRFSPTLQALVTIIMLFNMSIGLTAEYTSIGDLFETVIGSNRIPIVLVIGVSTMLYTASGGLSVSIITDQAQALFSLLFVGIMAVYIAVTFRQPLSSELPPNIAPNYYGYSAIAVMPISLTCASIYNEGFWQRVWASADDKALKTGALFAMGMVTVVIFFLGFCGFLAAWAGLEVTNPNTVLFTLLGAGGEAPIWITVMVTVLAATMNQSAVDSLQNALVDSISSVLLKGKSVWWSRLVVVVVNIPLVVVSLQGYPVMNLFLLSNMIASCCTCPILLGLSRRLQPYVTTGSVISGWIISFLSVMVYGAIHEGNVGDGLHFTFFGEYDWPPFLLAIVFSVVGVFLYGVPAKFIRGPGEDVFSRTTDVPVLNKQMRV